MKDAPKRKPESKKRLRGRPKKRGIDEPDRTLRIPEVDNPEELRNGREKWRRLYGSVMGPNSL